MKNMGNLIKNASFMAIGGYGTYLFMTKKGKLKKQTK